MSIVPWLDADHLAFPSSELALAEPNGLLAIGGDLSPERLIQAYRHGAFPWYEEPQPILWWSPNPRAVLFPEKIIISKSLRKRLRRGDYRVTADQQFRQVIEYCSSVPRAGQNGTWINRAIIDAYVRLHQRGVAHSIEVWHQQQLVGGLYGLAIGGIFFGESMFSLQTDASKTAFVYLARQLQQWNFAMIDCQVSNPHLFSLGAEEIERSEFERLLSLHLDNKLTPHWTGSWDHLAKV